MPVTPVVTPEFDYKHMVGQGVTRLDKCLSHLLSHLFLTCFSAVFQEFCSKTCLIWDWMLAGSKYGFHQSPVDRVSGLWSVAVFNAARKW